MLTTTTGKYVAQQFVASSPQAEMLGVIIEGFLHNLRTEEIREFLMRYGLETIDPKRWYSQQLILNIEKAIVEAQINASENLVALGMEAVEHQPFPPTVKTIGDGILAIKAIMASVTRNVPPDETMDIIVQRPGYMLVVVNMPFAADSLYGYLWGVTRRFRPPKSIFSVKKVNNPDPENHPGMAFEITWS